MKKGIKKTGVGSTDFIKSKDLFLTPSIARHIVKCKLFCGGKENRKATYAKTPIIRHIPAR